MTGETKPLRSIVDKNWFQNDASQSGRDGWMRGKDAGSVRSSATDATEDEAAAPPSASAAAEVSF